MNAITKRLLSFVIVLAMVLSMTPAITFSADAATTTQMTAVEAWHTAEDGALKFADQTGEVSATCPVCSPNTPVTWAPMASASALSGASGTVHYYLPTDLSSVSSADLGRTANQSAVCLYLNDHKMDVAGSWRLRGTFNLIAGPSEEEGTNTITRSSKVQSSNTYNQLFYALNLYVTINFYGGTYKSELVGYPMIRSEYKGKVNIYDGTFTSVSSVYGTTNAANGGATSTLTVYDGTLTGGAAGAVTLNHSGDSFIMKGGSITGEVKAANAGATITLSGAPTITAATGGNGLVLNGVLANVDGLTADANIQVTGALDEVLSAASDNAATAAQGFTVTGDSGYIVEANTDNQLVIVEPEPEPEPSTGVCPHCGGTEAVEWVEYTGQHVSAETALTAENDHKHYKLAADYAYTAGYALYITNGTACFDLAGNSTYITSGGTTAFYNEAGTLAIVDTVGGGTVEGGAGDSTVKTGSAAATVYLRGGTFSKKAGANTRPVVNLTSGGTVNLYEGATITTDGATGSNRHGACVQLVGSSTSKATFNMYGGTVTVGTGVSNQGSSYPGAAICVGRPTEASNAELNISGGTVIGGNAANADGDCIYVKNGCTLNISGTATINGEIFAQGETAVITLAGTPTITAGGSANKGLVLNGAPANIDKLAAGAKIAVSGVAGDTLTAASDNATAVKDCFILASTEMTIAVVDNQLKIVATLVLPSTCPYCGALAEDVEWIALGTPTGEYAITASGHYYLADNFESNTTGRTIYVDDGDDDTRTAFCLYLNGNNITNKRANATGSVINARYDIVNIWGEGTVSNAGGTGNLFDYGGSGEVNIYGGTYIHNSTGDMFANVAFSPIGTDEETGAEIRLDNHVNVYAGSFNADLSKVNSVAGGREMVAPWNVSVVNGDSETVYADGDAALAAYNGGYIRANQDATLNITGNTYIDAAGNVVTVTGNGTLYGMDSSGDDYATTGGKFLLDSSVQIARDVTGGANGYRYILVNGGTYEGYKVVRAYRLELKLSTVTLRPATGEKAGQMGLYYKAAISCGPELASLLGAEGNAYGVVLSLVDMPGADFMNDVNDKGNYTNQWTEKEGAQLDVNAGNEWTVVLNSGSVFGIMKTTNRTPEKNAEYGEMPIYANAYLSIDFAGDGNFEVIMADTVNGNTNNGVKYSLFDVLHAINQKWESYADYHDSLNNFYTYWYDFGMSAWGEKLTNFTKKNG